MTAAPRVVVKIEGIPDDFVDSTRLMLIGTSIAWSRMVGVPRPVLRMMRDELATETHAARAMREARALGRRMRAARVNVPNELFMAGHRVELRKHGLT